MFPRLQRLRTTKDILLVVRRGIRQHAGLVSCSFLSKPGTLGRVTVVVDTKVAKQATVRNRLKRQIRALLRSSALPEGDLMVRLKPGSADTTFAELSANLQQCLSKIRRS